MEKDATSIFLIFPLKLTFCHVAICLNTQIESNGGTAWNFFRSTQSTSLCDICFCASRPYKQYLFAYVLMNHFRYEYY